MTALVFRLWQKPNENHNIAIIGKIVAILQQLFPGPPSPCADSISFHEGTEYVNR